MLNHETEQQLWRDLIGRCAMPNNRPPMITWPLTLLLTVLVLYLFAKL